LRTAFGQRDTGLLAELEKQYKVEFINPTAKIELEDPKAPLGQRRKYDVLLAVQPSSLGPVEMGNLVEAINTGIPTAIFEDPLPLMVDMPGTSQPRTQRNPMMMPFQPPQELPKGDIDRLWNLLDVRLLGKTYPRDPDDISPLRGLTSRASEQFETLVVWQNYNPYRHLRASRSMTNSWVFVRDTAPGGRSAFDASDPVTRSVFELLFPYPGAIEKQGPQGVEPTMTALVRTGDATGTIRHRDVMAVHNSMRRFSVDAEGPDLFELPFEMRTREVSDPRRYVLAARIRGKTSPKPIFGGNTSDPDRSATLPPGRVNVILVADADMLHSIFIGMRATPDAEMQNEYEFQNVPFVLNVLDSLAGDDRFINIRNRRQHYGTLTRFEQRVEDIRQQIDQTIEEAATEYKRTTEAAEEARRKVQKEWEDKLAKLEASQSQNISEVLDATFRSQLEIDKKSEAEEIEKRRARRTRNERLTKADDDRERAIRALERNYKLLAVTVPPLPPLVLALCVFLYRRAREREGMSRTRRK
jgi:ABC-2 type transport system permease protein